MTSFDMFWLIVLPSVLCAPFIWLLFCWAIPEAKNDAKWHAYMKAWDEWDKNGKNGVMPEPKDYGYRNDFRKKDA